MSRIRTIKPEFWTSEQIVSCSIHARLLFIGLWNFCDDNGVHPASYVRLKAEIFPVDVFTIEEFKHWIGELIANDLVREYSVDDKTYWIVTGWKKHQRIDKPTHRHPLPLSDSKKIQDISSNAQRLFDDNSQIYQRVIGESSITDRNGKEGNGKEKDICKIFSHWRHVMKHPHAKLDKKRKKKIEEALNLSYTPDELELAIDGCSKTPFNVGQNERGQRYDSIDLIFRDADHIDQFITNATKPPISMPDNSSKNNPMAGAL